MNIKRGNVVLLDFPFSDGRGSKVRPALVVQSDAQNAKLTSTIVVLITRVVHRAAREATQFFVGLNTPECRKMGLRFASAVNCASLYTVHESRVIGRIGTLPEKLQPVLDNALAESLGLR